jgi:hypothetical protein
MQPSEASAEIVKQLEAKLAIEQHSVRQLRERVYGLEKLNADLVAEAQKLLTIVSKHQRLYEDMAKLLASAR